MANPKNNSPDQTGGMEGIKSFFSDPRNLATGLVFLAALAQQREPGQSVIGKVGQSAVAGLGFRGGLDKGIRQQQEREEETAARRLQETRENELRGRQVKVQEEGVGLQREQLTQAERLAKDQRELQLKLKQTPDALTGEQANLLNQQAGYYSRMPTAGGGGDGKGGMNDIFADLMKTGYEQEVQTAALEGRPFDYTKATQPALGFMQQMQEIGALQQAGGGALPYGTTFERDAQGRILIVTPSGAVSPGAEPPLSAPVQTGPVEVAGPKPLTEQIGQAAIPRPSKKSPGKGVTAAKSKAEFEIVQALQGRTDEELRNIARSPTVDKAIAVGARRMLHRREVQKRAMMGSPGMR